MNTPAHLIVNLAVLGSGERRSQVKPILAGALLPDLPMFLFYVWQRGVVRATESAIWRRLYFEPDWQAFFDVFNSIPLALLGLLSAWRLRSAAWRAFFASWVLHCVFDLAVHREDAHGHLFPLSDWRFTSPVSYWDPAHHGTAFAGIETLAVVVGSLLLWRRYESRSGRVALLAACVLYLCVYLGFYLGGAL